MWKRGWRLGAIVMGACLVSASMDTLEEAAEAALSASDPMAARDAVRRVLGA